MSTQTIDRVEADQIREIERTVAGVAAGFPRTERPVTAAGQTAFRRRQRAISRTAPRAMSVSVTGRGLRRADCVQPEVPAYRLGRWARLATTVVVAAVLGVLATTVVSKLAAGSVSGQTEQTQTVVVQRGDTLWSIATQADPAADPRDVVERIKELNGLSGQALPVGIELSVPISG